MMTQQAHGNQHHATAAGASPIGQLYDVGGRRLWLHRSGAGGPAVVFLAGAGAVGLDYLNIHDRISGFTTSVLYDRGGIGWSDPMPLPRTAAEVATELRDLLHVAGVPGPYLLVAHSLGGAYARRFAQLFPDQVAGLLLLESFYEDWDSYMPEQLQLARSRQPEPGRLQLRLVRPLARRMYRQMFASWPEPVRQVLIGRHLSPEWWLTGVRERSNMPELAAEIRRDGDVPDVPLITVTALATDPGQAMLMSKKTLRELTEAKLRMYAALAGSATRGEHRPLEEARHSQLTTDRPDAVIQAVRDLLGQSRS
jgi:pimeloyl-ACP methyl ester carboxylesterase